MITDNESQLLIPGPVGALELLTQAGDQQGSLGGMNFVAIIAHPHPLHGGTMTNKVVTTMTRVYRQLGVDTVRFNFRGVGQSEGVFDQGQGELADLLAVFHWLKAHRPDVKLLLAGFSFGSAVAAAASFKIGTQHLVLVAPPIERYAYDRQGKFTCPFAMVIGAQDELVDVAGAEAWFEAMLGVKSRLVIPDAGHFFHGRLTLLKSWLMEQLMNDLGRPVDGELK